MSMLQSGRSPDPRNPLDAEATSFIYDAFLSYSRSDEAVADGLQKGLHRVGRKVGRLHALRISRDKTDLAASPSLWDKITEEMDRSRYFIVVLSPQAAASNWVNKEVAYWLQRPDGPEHLLLAWSTVTSTGTRRTGGLTLHNRMPLHPY